ncbi:MAG: DUF2339 domain-containing protein [Victivallaceae bacterium]|nr:DUF2339 domain-containing protein [Victivallaceae bacterium]
MNVLIILGLLLLGCPTILMIVLIVMQKKSQKLVAGQEKNMNRLWWQLNDITKQLEKLIPQIPNDKKAVKNIPTPVKTPPAKVETPVKESPKPVSAPIQKPPSNPVIKVQETPNNIEIKNNFEAKVTTIFEKAVQWFIVGDDFRGKDVSKEYAVATTWLIRGAILIILVGLAFFLKYSIEKDLIPPYLRVAITGTVGIGMLISSLLMANKKYHKIAMGLLGGGIAVLYFSIFAAYGIYHLITVGPAYGFMILITLTAGVLAVRMNSLLAAIFGIIGGYATPVLLHTNVPNLPGFFSYILLLGLGALFIARYRNWRSLNFMSFVFTYVLFLLAVEKAYSTENDFAITIAFLSAYFVLFSGLSIFYNLIHKRKIIIIELLTMLVNISIYIGLGLMLIENKFGDLDYGAILTTGVAVFYIAQILCFIKLKVKDRNLLLVLFTFAAFAITITFPILLSGKYLVCAWAAQAFLFLWLSCKIQSSFLRKLSYILYAMCFWHLAALDMGDYFVRSSPYYLDGLINRFLSMGTVTLSTIAAFLTLKKEAGRSITSQITISPENDIPRPDSPNYPVFFWISFVFIFVFLHFETYYFGKAFYKALYLPLQTYIWLGALAFCSWKLKDTKKDAYSKLIVLLLVGLIIKLVFVDLEFWSINTSFIYSGQLLTMPIIIRFAGIIPLLALLLCLREKLSNEDNSEAVTVKKIYAVAALATLFVYLTFELNFVLHHTLPSFRQGGVSILWGLFALTMVFTGIRKDIKALRISGLTLFGIIAVKIFLIDLSGQSPLVRTSVFIVLGLVMLAGAFLYIRFKDTFAKQGEKNND